MAPQLSLADKNTKWLRSKYALSAQEAREVAAHKNLNALIAEHESWLKRNGYPAHSSPISRGELLALSKETSMFASNPIYDVAALRAGDPVEIRIPIVPPLGQLSKGEHFWKGGYEFVKIGRDGLILVPVGGDREDWFSVGPNDARLGRGTMSSNPSEKIKAVSMYRYRGGAQEKRLYGGQGTITEFWIYFGDEKEPMKIQGHGPTPGERKTDAIARAKKIRAERGMGPLAENPSGGGIVMGLLALAAAGGVLWLVLRPSEASAATAPAPTLPAPPPPQKPCTSYDALSKFSIAKGYKIYYVETIPVAQWQPPKPEYMNNLLARSYSVPDCGFYKWTGLAWVPDTALDAELAGWVQGSTETAPAPAPATPLAPAPTAASTPMSSPNATPYTPIAPQPASSKAVQWLPPEG